MLRLPSLQHPPVHRHLSGRHNTAGAILASWGGRPALLHAAVQRASALLGTPGVHHSARQRGDSAHHVLLADQTSRSCVIQTVHAAVLALIVGALVQGCGTPVFH